MIRTNRQSRPRRNKIAAEAYFRSGVGNNGKTHKATRRQSKADLRHI